jgi:hypothetical protein
MINESFQKEVAIINNEIPEAIVEHSSESEGEDEEESKGNGNSDHENEELPVLPEELDPNLRDPTDDELFKALS